MMVVLNQGGIGSGGLNFDAKPRRGSCDEIDLFYAHICGIDTFARALLIAHKIIEDKKISGFMDTRYSSWTGDMGIQVLKGKTSLADMDAYVENHGEPARTSGRQEYLESLINSYI